MSERLIIGLGTGHCGTRSLAKLFSLQEDTIAFHEFPPPVAISSTPGLIKERLDLLLCQRPGTIADVAFWYLPFVKLIWSQAPSAKFICLERPKDEFIHSVLKYIAPGYFPLQYFKTNPRVKGPEFGMCFPQYPHSLTKEQALGSYWEDYHKTINGLTNTFPNYIRSWPLEALNNKTLVGHILNFAGFPNPVVRVGIKIRSLGPIQPLGDQHGETNMEG